MTFFAVFLFSLRVGFAAIFGVDGRVAITPSSPFAQTARATAIAVLSTNHSLSDDKKFLRLDVDKFENMCKTEKFSSDPSLSYACSGFLVAPDIIMTAGHCMVNTGESHHETQTYCKAFSWLFDYSVDATGKIDTQKMPAENHYRCKEVIYAVKDERAPFRDYALVRLNRKVVGREPLKLATNALLAHDRVSMIGYPLGSPAKRSAPAKILLNDLNRQSFLTSLDAFEGNSGSAVLNGKEEVVGILVGGTPIMSFARVPGRSCEVFNRCSETGLSCLDNTGDPSEIPGFQGFGSEVQRIEPVRKLLQTILKRKT